MRTYRQGDILLKAVDFLPQDARPLDTKVVAYGEVTGHSHRFEDNAILLEGTGGMFVQASGDAPLVHDEHETIIIPEGTYQVIRQREYDEEQIRYVAD